MTQSRFPLSITGFLMLIALASPTLAQTEPPPPPASPWSGSLGAGAGLTRGNSDTSTYNLALLAVRDPKTDNVIKIDALYLHSEKDGDAIVDQSTFGFRYEKKLKEKLFAFGDLRYLQDEFKRVDFLVATTAGVGYQVIKTEPLSLSFDAGAGALLEKLEGLSRTTGGVYRAGEVFLWKISPTASLGQSVTALWKSKDTADAIYHFELSLAAAITAKSEIKLAFIDDYKTRPASGTKKNDSALVTTFAMKF